MNQYIEDPGYRIDQDMIDELRACVIQGNLKRFESNVKEIKRHPNPLINGVNK
jgi:hypothetical protein